MPRFFVRCKIEDVKRDLWVNAFEYARCEDPRFVEFPFDDRDNTMLFWELLATRDTVATYGEVGQHV